MDTDGEVQLAEDSSDDEDQEAVNTLMVRVGARGGVAGHGGGRKLSCIDGIDTTIYNTKIVLTVTNTATFNRLII